MTLCLFQLNFFFSFLKNGFFLYLDYGVNPKNELKTFILFNSHNYYYFLFYIACNFK